MSTNNGGPQWSPDATVTVPMPDGTEEEFPKLSARNGFRIIMRGVSVVDLHAIIFGATENENGEWVGGRQEEMLDRLGWDDYNALVAHLLEANGIESQRQGGKNPPAQGLGGSVRNGTPSEPTSPRSTGRTTRSKAAKGKN